MLGWTPDTYWKSTPKEFLLAVEGYRANIEKEDNRVDILMMGLRRVANIVARGNGYKGREEDLMPLHIDKKPKVGNKKFDLTEEEIKNRLGRKIKDGK